MSHNVSKKVLLTEPKLSKNSKPFWSFLPGRVTEIYPLSKDKGLKYKLYSMSMELDTRKPNFGSQQWLWFHIWFMMTLYYKIQQMLSQSVTAISLQNASNIYYNIRQIFGVSSDCGFIFGSWWSCTTKFNKYYHKVWQLFHYKMWQTFITIYVRFFYYKMQQFYCKMWQVLQNATILLQNMTVITKYDVHASVHSGTKIHFNKKVLELWKHMFQWTPCAPFHRWQSMLVMFNRLRNDHRSKLKISHLHVDK